MNAFWNPNQPILLEEEIIRLCKEQDRRAQRLLYEQYDRKMFLLCYRYVRDRHHAEDVLVKGFYKIFKNLPQFEHRGSGSLEGWMRRILVNECLMFLRSQKRLKFAMEGEAEHVASRMQPDADLRAEDIFKVIRRLPDGYRTVFNLFAIEGYSHKEIAAQLGISENTSKSQLSKARKLLKTYLQKEENRHERSIY